MYLFGYVNYGKSCISLEIQCPHVTVEVFKQRLGHHFHFSLSCIGERNGNPLQCSCLENPRDKGAQWAAIYGVVQSRTQLKRLSSSSSSCWFKFLNHFELIFIWCEVGVYPHCFACGYPVVSAPLLKGLFFPLLNRVGSFVNNHLAVGYGFLSELSVLFHWSIFMSVL